MIGRDPMGTYLMWRCDANHFEVLAYNKPTDDIGRNLLNLLLKHDVCKEDDETRMAETLIFELLKKYTFTRNMV